MIPSITQSGATKPRRPCARRFATSDALEAKDRNLTLGDLVDKSSKRLISKVMREEKGFPYDTVTELFSSVIVVFFSVIENATTLILALILRFMDLFRYFTTILFSNLIFGSLPRGKHSRCRLSAKENARTLPYQLISARCCESLSS